MKIEVAGAGAGKTTKLAQKIIDKYSRNNGKMIYCVSFTNSSVNTIINKLESYYGEIPKNIKVTTIHSFLNSEFITPYYYLLYNKQFHNVSNTSLGSDPKYKNTQLKKLENRGFLHVESFTAKAKYIICGKSTDRKRHRDIRKKIQALFSNYFDVLYVDEAQDIDKNFKEILIKFNELGIDIELIGDPKQDLKGFGFLSELVEKYPQSVSYIKESHRCPECHLNFSNKYVKDDEKQISPEGKKGELKYYFESDINSLQNFIFGEKYDLTYIYQKNHVFDTHSITIENLLFGELKQIISKLHDKQVNDIWVIKMASKITHKLIMFVISEEMAPNKAITRIFPYKSIEVTDYYRLLEALTAETTKDRKKMILVKSIEAVKGLEANRCLFIITPPIVPYLLGQKSKGKVGANLYVALTRSKQNLHMLVTAESEKKFGKDTLEKFFSKN